MTKMLTFNIDLLAEETKSTITSGFVRNPLLLAPHLSGVLCTMES